jgi:phytoene synthase
MTPTLYRSYHYCDRLARRQAANFYPAFRLLPRQQRLSMCALYAFMRVADDLSDEPGEPSAKRAALDDWRRRFDAALAGHYTHVLHPALHHTVATSGIPAEYLHAVVDGVGMDLEPVRLATFGELYRYCYHVASAVGLACIHVWGFRGERAKEYAEAAGIAFQMTNILRDVAEDAGRGRVYLPAEDLERFGCTPEQVVRGERGEGLRGVLKFEADRAYGYYEASRPLRAMLPPPGRAVFQAMSGIYRGLLDAIVRRDFDVFSGRVKLSKRHKLWLAMRALPVSWGWG